MKNSILRIAPFILLLAILAAAAVASPAPPHLEKLTPFRPEREAFESFPPRVSSQQNGFRYLINDFRCIRDLGFSPDSKTLYTTVSGRGVWIWDVASRKCTDFFEPELFDRHARYPRTIFSPDGKTAASLADRRILLWDMDGRKIRGALNEDESVECIAFSHDGKNLSAIVHTRMPRGCQNLRIWDVDKMTRVQICDTMYRQHYQVAADSGIQTPLLAHSTEDAIFTLLDAFTAHLVLTCEWKKEEAPMPFRFAMNRAETMVASSGANSPVQLWDRHTGRRIARFKPRPYHCRGLAFNPDGTLLAAFYDDWHRNKGDCDFVLYDVRSGKIRAEVKLSGGISAWAFSPDKRLLAVKNDKEIKVWRIPDSWRR